MSRVFLLLVLLVLTGCLNNTAQDASTQRRIGETTFDDGVRLLLSFGTFRRVDSSPIVARAASPAMRMRVRSGPVTDGSRTFEIRNVAIDAELSVLSVALLTANTEEGCDFGETRTIICDSETSTECNAPMLERDEEEQTTVRFDFDVPGCRDVLFEVATPDVSTAAFKFVVMGPTDELDAIDAAAVVAADMDAEFLVLLGDATPSSTNEGLDDLETRTNQLALPVVVIAGDNEQGVDAGSGFLRRFGPHEHSWLYQGGKFFTFFSATGSLGDEGIDRLDRTLAQLQRRGDDNLPLVGFTHRPPLDPEGTRDAGFRNKLEGARVQAILKRYNVAMLFTGESTKPDYSKVGDLEVVLTGAGSSPFRDGREVVVVTITDDGDVEFDRTSF